LVVSETRTEMYGQQNIKFYNNGCGPLKNKCITPLLFKVKSVSSMAISLKLHMDGEV